MVTTSFPHQMGRKADRYSITEDSTHYNAEALMPQELWGYEKRLTFGIPTHIIGVRKRIR